MKHLLLKTIFACSLTCTAWSASAIGREADVNVIDRNTGQSLPVHFHRGEYWVAGQPGAKYSIQIRNSRGSRVLAVTSVDGLNVLSGETADFGQSGYVFGSGERYGIEGWRKSDHEVAAFVFTASSGDSYAERMGRPRDIGVIGVALFREKPPVPVYSPPVYSKPSNSRKSESQAPAANQSLKDESLDRSSKKMSPTAEAAATTTPAPMPSPKLGTAHGERERSVVSHTQFVRKSERPDEIIRIRYDSHVNLVARGVIPSPSYLPGPNAFPGSPMGYVPDPLARY